MLKLSTTSWSIWFSFSRAETLVYLCFSLPKLLYFLRTSPCFEEVDLLQQYDSIIRKSLSKICNVNFDESSYTQAILPVSKGGIGIASASQIALPAFLASATGAKRALSCILPEDYVDASFEKALDLWLTRANLTEAPSGSIQKHWSSPLSDATFDQLITDLDAENVKRLNAYQVHLVQLGWMLYQAKISVWSWQISNCASPYPSAWVRKFARNTLAAVGWAEIGRRNGIENQS